MTEFKEFFIKPLTIIDCLLATITLTLYLINGIIETTGACLIVSITLTTFVIFGWLSDYIIEKYPIQ